jgi:hypothetical protein
VVDLTINDNDVDADESNPAILNLPRSNQSPLAAAALEEAVVSKQQQNQNAKKRINMQPL